jgi:hypothetical protein
MAGIDSYTKLMLHCDGSDASTTFTDSELTPKTMTAVGNAQIDTAQSKFGGASGLFDGTGDYLTVPDSADWVLGTGDFTIDFWVRFNALPTNGNWVAFYEQDSGGSTRVLFDIYNDAGTYQPDFLQGGTDVFVNSSGLSTNTWYHIALVRSGNSIYFFQDGVQQGATQTFSDSISDWTSVLRIGHDTNAGHPSQLNGWLDEYRISVGIARWTANFTPPTAAYSVDNTTNFFNFF